MPAEATIPAQPATSASNPAPRHGGDDPDFLAALADLAAAPLDLPPPPPEPPPAAVATTDEAAEASAANGGEISVKDAPVAELNSTPSPMASLRGGSGNSLVGNDELLNALAELGDTPSLDEPTSSAAPAGPAKKEGRFKIGKKPDGAAAPPPPPPPPPPPVEPSPSAAEKLDTVPLEPRVTIVKRILRALDAVLEALHRPFERLPMKLRRFLGPLGLATALICGFFAMAQPVLFPHRDATSFLADRVAAITNPPPAASPAGEEGEEGAKGGHGEEAKGGHGKAPAGKSAGGHGEAKPKPKADAKGGHGEAKPSGGHGESAKPAKAAEHGKPAKSEAGHGAKPAEKGHDKPADKGHGKPADKGHDKPH